ncbi:hypothetical protein Lalb_Chr13g0304071 [Lupinus albus]|uniref:Uncharacterized protein n=1 Tax=Lupinus albus TaxID=3870 RepID=A0A6A4PKH3_LUPAL|nr:hypothetical protein Lalb_Chr13g0304071 [Lupinus albus]
MGYIIKLNIFSFKELNLSFIMARQSMSMMFSKPQLILRRCSRHLREKKTRFYIIWRCVVILIELEE